MSNPKNGGSRPKTGLIQRVVAILRSEISSGNWPVGSRIPTEPELSKLTGVGRNTVREAVQSLVHAGMLERRQGSGTYVLADNEVIVQLSRIAGVDAKDHKHTLEAFGGLWVAACSHAAERRTVRHAEDLAEATLDLVGDPALVVCTDTDLTGNEAPPRIHAVIQVIFEAAHSDTLTDMAKGLLVGIGDHSVVTCSGQSLLECSRAVAAGDPKAALSAGNRVSSELSIRSAAVEPMTHTGMAPTAQPTSNPWSQPASAPVTGSHQGAGPSQVSSLGAADSAQPSGQGTAPDQAGSTAMTTPAADPAASATRPMPNGTTPYSTPSYGAAPSNGSATPTATPNGSAARTKESADASHQNPAARAYPNGVSATPPVRSHHRAEVAPDSYPTRDSARW